MSSLKRQKYCIDSCQLLSRFQLSNRQICSVEVAVIVEEG